MYRDSQQDDSLTLEEWTSVLNLSSMWQFHAIRATAIKVMGNLSMDLVDKIVIARRYDISSWLVSALNALVQREKPIDMCEGNRLGMGWVLKVAELREGGAALSTPACTHCNYTGAPRCNSCSSTTFNRCGSCNNQLPTTTPASGAGKRGNRSNIDYSERIREVFNLV
jgi:hypothetical protein